MLSELPLFIGCWLVGLFIILLPSFIVQLFGTAVEEEDDEEC